MTTPASANAARQRTAAMPFIMVTVLIDMVSIGLIIPVLPALVGSFTGSQTEQAFWYGAVTFAFGIANFLASPMLGALSDRYGRRPVLLLGFCGLALSFFVTALATALWMLIAVRLFSGAMQANISVANAYVADITPPRTAPGASACSGAMFGIGFILGPVMGGLLGAIDLHLPFFAAGSLALINLLYGWFVLPESLPPERRRPFDWKSRQPGEVARAGSAQLQGVGRAGRGDRLQRRWRSSCSTPAGCSTPPSSSAGGRCENGWSLFAVGVVSALGAGLPARPAAEALHRRSGWRCWGWSRRRSPTSATAPPREGWMMFVVIVANILGFTRRGVDPEHHLQRRRPDARQGQTHGRGERPEQPDGGDRAGARRAAARRGLAPAARRLADRHAVLLLRLLSGWSRSALAWIATSARHGGPGSPRRRGPT